MKEYVIISLPFGYNHMAWHMVLAIWWEISYGWIQLLSKTWPCLHHLNQDQMLFWGVFLGIWCGLAPSYRVGYHSIKNNLGWKGLQEVSSPSPAQSRMSSEIRLGYSWLCTAGSWKPPGMMRTAELLLQPVLLFDWYIWNCWVKFKAFFFHLPESHLWWNKSSKFGRYRRAVSAPHGS